MRKIFIYGFLLAIIISFSTCKKTHQSPDDCSNYDYHDCNTLEPTNSSLKMSFSLNSQIHSVPFVIYKGNVEDNSVLYHDTAFASEVIYSLDFGSYSVKAEYHINGKTIYAIDGGKMIKWSNNVCDSTCWSADSLSLDLRIH